MSNQEARIDLEKQVKQYQIQLNERLLKRVNKAVVFADAYFIEWLHLTTGLEAVLKAGALNVKEFNSFQNGEGVVKGVFFISQPLKTLIFDTLKEIVSASQFQIITVITNLSPIMYGETQDYIDFIRDELIMSMGNANYTCDIICEKFPFASLTPPHPTTSSTGDAETCFFLNLLSSWSLFSSASYNNLNQLISLSTYQNLVKQEISSGGAVGSDAQKDFQQYYHHFNPYEMNELRCLCCSINQMLEILDAKDDCFSLGILSAIVANELNNSAASKQRRKAAPNKATLLLIDRNVDLPMVSLYQEETIFDKIVNMLPNLCPTSNDVQVDLSKFIFESEYKSMAFGNLFHVSTDACRHLVEQFLSSKPKESLLDIYRKLCEVCPLTSESSSSGKEKKPQRINADSLKSQIKNGLRVNKKLFFENLNLIQMVSAYCQINDANSTQQVQFDKLVSFVKSITQHMLDKEGPSILSRVYALFRGNEDDDLDISKAPSYSVCDLIILLIYVYSLIGEECYYGTEEEERIKKLLVDELESDTFQNGNRADVEFVRQFAKNFNQNYQKFVDAFFQNLKSLKFFRKNFKQYNKLIHRDNDKQPFAYKPILKQVCETLIKTDPVSSSPSDQLVDIEYRTSNVGGEGLKDLFKSFTMSYLKNTPTKVHPMSNDLLIIYFVGGITAYEMKLAKEAFKNCNKNVLIGSSHFYNHKKLIKYMFE